MVNLKPVTKLRAEGIGSVCGRLYFGTAEKIPPSELIDTTGAGDAFTGAVLYDPQLNFRDRITLFTIILLIYIVVILSAAICANLPPEKMLPFASYVAAAKCRALGARAGLPYGTNPYLTSFTEYRVLENSSKS
ncbi:hypothetical protein ACSQ67_014753 [Phaseolus vulgaris]